MQEFKLAVINAHRRHRMRSQPIAKYVRRVLRKAKQRKARVSVIFVDSRLMRRLNRNYLSHDYGTDILSFCLEKKGTLEGEIYINLDRARQQAMVYKATFPQEVARLVIHGTLHLVGYDDRGRTKAAIMRREEEEHLSYWFS